MKKLLLLLALLFASAQAQIWVAPGVAGNGDVDSVIVSFCTFDTTLYPVIADADSIVALRFDPDNQLIDSLTQSAPTVIHPRTGWYELHYRAANDSGELGVYRVYVRVKIGGDWRGAAAVTYQVIGADVGDYFAQISAAGLSSGTGAYPCTLHVFESASSAALSGAFVRAMNSDESATIASGKTDPNGRIIFALDAYQYHVFASLTGCNADDLPLLLDATSGGANDTVYLDRFEPGVAPFANLCRVYGYVSGLDGQGIGEVIVTARIAKSPLQHEGVVISPFALASTTDTTGYWFLDLIPSGALDPDDTKYDLTLQYPSGVILRKQVSVPDSPNFWLRW
ncbi:MAG: hypothetical protein WBP29_03040 [Candidatus Zixiibacteriota bacterium]